MTAICASWWVNVANDAEFTRELHARQAAMQSSPFGRQTHLMGGDWSQEKQSSMSEKKRQRAKGAQQ